MKKLIVFLFVAMLGIATYSQSCYSGIPPAPSGITNADINEWYTYTGDLDDEECTWAQWEMVSQSQDDYEWEYVSPGVIRVMFLVNDDFQLRYQVKKSPLSWCDYCTPVNSYSTYISACQYANTPGRPSDPGSAPTVVPRTFYGEDMDDADSYEWSITGGSYYIMGSSSNYNITIRFTSSFTTYSIKYRAVNECGNSSWSQVRSYYSLL